MSPTSDSRLYCLGIDPGASTGIALTIAGKGNELPILLRAFSVHGDRDGLWIDRADDAFLELLELLPEGVEPSSVVQLMETPPITTTRHNTLKGDSRGMASWRGLGEYMGRIRVCAYRAGWQNLRTVQQSQWASSWGPLIRRAKQGDGSHRIQEASRIEGAAAALEEVANEKRRVDVAEAILISGAGAMGLDPSHRKRGRRRRT